MINLFKNKFNFHFLLSISIFILLVIWIIICAVQYWNDFSMNVDAYNKLLEICNPSLEMANTNTCNEILNNGGPVIPDTFTIFFQLLINSNLCYIQLIAPFVIFILSSYDFYREYNTGFYKNKLMRMPYKEYIKTFLLKAYKNIWIFPMWLLVLFIASYIISGHFDLNKTLSYWPTHYIPVDIEIIKNFIPFMLIFIVNLIFNNLFYVHIALITVKKNSNFIVSILSSYLIFIFCDIILEIFIGIFIGELLLNISHASSLFNLFNYWVYSDIPNIWIYILYCFMLALGSFIIFYLIYGKKEDVIIASEK